MTLDEQLTRAARHIADGLNPPAVDLDGIRARARSNRRRGTALAIAATSHGRDRGGRRGRQPGLRRAGPCGARPNSGRDDHFFALP